MSCCLLAEHHPRQAVTVKAAHFPQLQLDRANGTAQRGGGVNAVNVAQHRLRPGLYRHCLRGYADAKDARTLVKVLQKRPGEFTPRVSNI